MTANRAMQSQIEDILYRHDPLGIGWKMGNPRRDKYAYEAESISDQLHEATSVNHLRDIVYEVFVTWFSVPGSAGSGELNAGHFSRYDGIAREIWDLRRASSIKEETEGSST